MENDKTMTDQWLEREFEKAFKLANWSHEDDELAKWACLRSFANRVLMKFGRDTETAAKALAVPYTRERNR